MMKRWNTDTVVLFVMSLHRLQAVGHISLSIESLLAGLMNCLFLQRKLPLSDSTMYGLGLVSE